MHNPPGVKILTKLGAIFFTFAVLLCPGTALGTNGMNMIGYGAVSSGMGGADLALVDNATAMNINPAGLTCCCKPQISAGISMLQSRNHHKDKHGNDLQAGDQMFPVPLLAWAQPLEHYPLIFGFGFFAQGGMGVDYRHFRTPFADMTKLPNEYDTLSSDITYMKVTPTLAWRNSANTLRLGISLNLGYAETAMSLFPETSIYLPAQSNSASTAFFGMKMKDARAYSAAFRAGFQYNMGALTIGGAYLSETNHKFRNGTTRINYTAINAGSKEYDTSLDGFNWPRQVGLGFSYQVNPAFKVALDIDWINWANAIKTITFKLRRQGSANVPGRMDIEYPMHWKNQWVVAMGMEYRLTSCLDVRCGYNYGENPIPSHRLLPYFPAIAEHHLTVGASYTALRWRIDLACEWALENSDLSNNSLFCEHGFTEKMSQFTSHIMLSYKL